MNNGMPATDGCALPPTFTSVFDTGNRWAAIRVNFAQGVGCDSRLLTSIYAALASEDDAGADNASPGNLLPLLLEADDPQWWAQVLAAAPPPCPIYLLLPAACFLSAETQSVLTELKNNQINLVALVAESMPDATNSTNSAYSAHALGFDASHGLNGHDHTLLRTFGGPNLAMNIDSHAGHSECLNAGFQWFDGAWALQPNADQGAQSTTSRSSLLKLLGLVSSDADSHDIETLLKRDPNLSCQLLKLVNSVGFSLSHKIENFNQAITLLGRRQLQRWLQLLLYAGHHANDASSALLCFAARRAALMEGLTTARGGKQDDKDQAFMVGLFSLLDVLFKTPIADLVTPLNLNDAMTQALIAHEGVLGRMLDVAIATEAVPSAALLQMLDELSITPDGFVHAQLESVVWAAKVSREM
jgi:EAL and modified HD-GYP domain-containing signal transduction protein